MTIGIRIAFEEDNNYYPQFFQMNVCMNYKCQDIIGQTFQKELMLTKQMHQMNMILVIIGVLKILILTMLLLFLLKEVIIEVIFWYISKHDTINIMKNSNLNEKSGFAANFFVIYKNG